MDQVHGFGTGDEVELHPVGTYQRIADLEAKLAGARAEVERLAQFIIHEIPGEPSQSEGAVDTAIRIIERLRADGERLDWMQDETSDGYLMNWMISLSEHLGVDTADIREVIDAAREQEAQ